MKAKSAATGLLALALGFGGGWLGRGMFPAHAGERGNESVPAPASRMEGTTSPERKIGSTAATPDFPPVAGFLHRAVTDRLHTLSWGKQKGLQIGVNVFSNDGLDPSFASVYDLSPAEVSALNTAIRAAKEKLFAIALQDAKVDPGADGSHFTVEVPSATDRGGAVYDSLLKSFADTLGPDRFQSFNDLSGVSFESGFGSFGLANTRYELSAPDSAPVSGPPLYKVVVSSTLPGFQSSSTSQLPLDEVGTYFPLLGHFIPPGFQPHRGAN